MSIHERASIVAIGTELTTGQITNRNAAWLSEKLTDLGIETILHETVADDRQMIRSALDRCKSLSGMIFITGGLGPTTDDFTREVIADWLGKPLRFYEPSWIKIEDRLTRLGVPVAASNRQQAFYPEQAEVIVNNQGTADAFTAQIAADQSSTSPPKTTQLWVLPGPPSEVECVWHNGIEAQVRTRVPHLRPLKLLTWQCIGKSEAELGEITERALDGSGLKTGYRAHRPYVEVKVWCTDEELHTKQTAIASLDRAIGPWVATRQGADLAERLLKAMSRADTIEITDNLSGGVLADRLGAFLREPEYAALARSAIVATEWTPPATPEEWVRHALDECDPDSLTMVIAGFNESGDWAFGLSEGERFQIEAGQTPYRSAALHDRSRRYAVEFALKRWAEWLEASTQ